MAAPLVQRVEIDTTSALRQINQLEAQLAVLNNPINVPVNLDSDGLRRDIAQADNQFGELNREIDQTQTELRQLDHQADRTGRELEGLGRRGTSAFTGLAVSAVGFIGAIAAFAGLGVIARGAFSAIQAASNLEESLSKTNVVFGDLSAQIQDFAATAPQALGLSTAAALEATSTFGNLFIALGLSREAAADLSPDIVQLAADLASFNNISVEEAVERLRSGLVGEVEPLRSLGVSLNAATVEAKAFELGLTDASGVVTEAGKVQARYALILEQTATAQGDFARTAEGIANRQRTLVAEFENLRAAVGEALLPAFESLLDVAPQLLVLIEGLVPAIQSFAQSFGDVVDTVQPFLENVTLIQQGVGAISDAFGAGQAVLRQSFEVLSSLATLQLEDFISNIGETGDVLGEFFDRFQDRSAIVGLAGDIAAGADASGALIQRLQQVAESNDLTAGTFERLATTAGLSGDALVATVRDLLDNAAAYNLDAQAVQALRLELGRLLGVENAVNFARKGRGGERPDFSFGFDPTGVDTTTDALERLNTVADGFNVRDLVDQIQQMGQGFTNVAPEIQNLPDLLSDARTALQAEQGGIVEDFDQFFTNLQTAITARQDFQGNLLILRAMGLDDLADTFEQLGLDSAKALADAITDPSAAAEAEALLESQARDQAAAFQAAFTEQLAGMIAILPVEVQLQQIQIPDIAAALNIGPFGGGQGVGDVIVNQTFVTEPQPTTQTQRAAQEINSIVANTRS